MADPGTLVDQSGRPLGPRAAETRRRLLDATEALLAERPLRELRVMDVARRVGTSPATFYQYFEDLEDAALRLAERAADEMPAIVAEIRGAWDDDALARARRIVEATIAHWDAHRAVLRVRNLRSEEGDPRFIALRRRVHGPVIEAFADAVRHAQRAGRVAAAVHPGAAGAALAAILERLAAYHAELRAFGVTREHLVETTARIVARTVTGPPASAA
ncbi:MAG TPA: TetR family transcriptional regulator [Myxococcota bacterium]|nr:TetR family transcriptional regulator [Myxococcota bacterium]